MQFAFLVETLCFIAGWVAENCASSEIWGHTNNPVCTRVRQSNTRIYRIKNRTGGGICRRYDTAPLTQR